MAIIATRQTHVLREDWVRGDRYSLQIPAEPEGLLAAGPDFLTRAFQAFGSLGVDNRLERLTYSREFSGGGSGRKLVLHCEYSFPEPGLPNKLFVKFSRHFTNELWDRARFMMVPEVTVAQLSTTPGFPVAVPRSMFADVEAATGTGLLITEQIPYGEGRVEPLYLKCMDHEVPDVLEHYQAILRGLAQLSGAHRAGSLSPEFDQHFPYDRRAALDGYTIKVSAQQLERRAHKVFDFIERYPHLFRDSVRNPELRNEFIGDIGDLMAKRDRIAEILCGNPDLIAFAHWNANIDNCWFWRESGRLQCGFIDWGDAGQMNLAQAVNGSIGSADPDFWHEHLDELLTMFIEEFAASGGPMLDLDELRLHVLLASIPGGVAFGLGAPVALTRELDDLGAVEGPRDEVFRTHENARIQLQMTTRFLHLWKTRSLGDIVRAL